MTVRIPQERFDPDNPRLGPIQMAVLHFVAANRGRRSVSPPDLESRGQHRKHVYSDLRLRGFLESVFLPDGSSEFDITKLGLKALKKARVMKAPKTGKARAPRGSLPLLAAQRAKRLKPARAARKQRKAA